MDTDLRASLIASGVAVVLSIIVGAAAGVGFLPLAARALGCGVLFGGLAWSALFLLRRFLPELFAGREEQESGIGGAVDIVLPAEGPGVDEDGLPNEEEIVGNVPRRPRAGMAARGPVDYAGEEFPYESESLMDGAAEDLEEVPAASPASRPEPLRGVEGLDDLDVLPDMESLSDGFSPGSADSKGAPSREFASSEPRVESRGGDTDPAVLAQAVRTILKRDQER